MTVKRVNNQIARMLMQLQYWLGLNGHLLWDTRFAV